MNATVEQEWVYQTIKRELDAQAERLKVREVIARRADGVCEVLEIIQIVEGDGLIVYVASPSYVNGKDK